MLSYTTLAVYSAALVATLILAAYLTPAHWWRQLNLRALAVVAIGTWAIGSLLMLLVPQERRQLALVSPTSGIASLSRPARPAPGSYRVFEDLNLRSARGTAAPRIAVVPAGAVVTTTGLRDGDWWQVSARVNGREVLGWSSSLWLRRADERRN